MRYGSLCSGIEAATSAWHHLGWEPAFFSEIEAFPCAVLAHHYPTVPNYGDMTKFKEWPDESIDILVGGTPCQSFSVAGLRKGLDDPRGNLALTYLAIADRYRPKWLVWENVPGVLSSNGGLDFGSFLGGLGQLGYGFAYRVLDAQYFGVPQRRRRVFVIGYLGDWQRAAAVLFERESLSGHPAPSRKKWEATARSSASGASSSRWPAEVASTLNAAFGDKQGLEDQHALSGASLFVPVKTYVSPAIGNFVDSNVASCLTKNSGGGGETQNAALVTTVAQPVAQLMQVRRLTPVECERLQGFPDNYTNIPYRNKATSPDGPRYKALGNSMAVPVMRWIGERIEMVEDIK